MQNVLTYVVSVQKRVSCRRQRQSRQHLQLSELRYSFVLKILKDHSDQNVFHLTFLSKQAHFSEFFTQLQENNTNEGTLVC